MIDNQRIKVSLVGQAGAGKTALIFRITENNFTNDRSSTIGVNTKLLTVNYNNNDFDLEFYDTAGQEVYKGSVLFYIRDSDIIVLCFDPQLQEAEKTLKEWRESLKDFADPHKIILVSTKSDLWDSNPSNLPFVNTPNQLPNLLDVACYIKTSSAVPENIDELVDNICSVYVNNLANHVVNGNGGVDVHETDPNQKSCC